MFLPGPRMRVWLYGQPTGVHQQFDGLAGLARNAVDKPPATGDLLMFTSHRRTYTKVHETRPYVPAVAEF